MDKYKIFEGICARMCATYKAKNADYGDAFAKARREIPHYTVGKLYDKFERFKTLELRGENTARVDERVEDTLLDLACYTVMELTEREVEYEKNQI